ncbi:unnamed protein product [Arabidopsis lyrata]|uniref:Gem-associated protein 2 n=1 Tax=Arabidopsis lyrata subsp. lyrata TaxID=81972 RepID=D7KNY4_ARALL|nr:uncharacterized protein LOC9327951 [Arabidopsis lyrata subsp. lyrata]EFH68148.1 hypothetical protein ARALYDRAFT_474711 [Arabidopsis lyrata subsp. lyrata]CAH8256821.1 unnamed protein product [Arabidopsis lyrata]|eukprot:XP_002891889.1 uncharacterized protein LOC9327951 [Arabidopsis lyrata subsp. lyrata]
MTTNSDSGHCIPAKTSVSRDGFEKESDLTKQLNSEIDPQASSSQTDAITMEDGAVSVPATVSAVLEDNRDLQQIKESSFFKESEQFGDDDVHKIEEVVDDTDGALQEQESEVQRLLEAEKRRLLAEIELGSIFRKRVDVDTLPKIEETMDSYVDKRSVKIDDTALVDVVTHPKRPGSAQNDKDAPRKHKKLGEKKPIDKINTFEVVEGSGSAKVCDFHNGGGENNGKQFRRVYTRKQLESMRFAHTVNQKILWSEMYARILPEVLTEYESLVYVKNYKSSKSNRVRGQTESCIGENLSTDEGAEDLTPEDYTDDNDDYNSILRPAFEVDGEPDFSIGPPEDGLEYLRRVRWEAKGIPNVRVAKIDESKYIKKEQSVYMPLIPEIPKCPEYLLPMKEWEDSLLSDFIHLRQTLSQSANSCEDEIVSSQCVDDLLVEIFNKHLHTEKDESFGGVVSDIQGMDSVTRVSKLKKRICLVEKESGLQSSDCKWVVALCASLETPLDADTCACLRGLLRKCASVRAEKSLEVGDEEVITMANMLITIAGRYFGQMGQ